MPSNFSYNSNLILGYFAALLTCNGMCGKEQDLKFISSKMILCQEIYPFIQTCLLPTFISK